ncbi:hypothetical protein GCM10007424_18100 [Flavobacterium suaedae]|uniref:DUF1705 domain-containing protein n=1 Tax=Flavobacterium suaedae TaxID=1767027 RepID=A0ABQ1JYJ7_9FLAO|nr:hypothetical protein [Flavobacterium suaedae]GGB78364.1 hypothetical protein GCM10007424_18100 [Flavobacterium suaedae]
MDNKNTSTLFYIGLLPFVIAVANMTLWIVTTTSEHATFEETVNDYLSYFPEMLQNATLLTLLNVMFLALAGGLFYKSMKSITLRTPAKILAIVSAVLLFWNVFSLM